MKLSLPYHHCDSAMSTHRAKSQQGPITLRRDVRPQRIFTLPISLTKSLSRLKVKAEQDAGNSDLYLAKRHCLARAGPGAHGEGLPRSAGTGRIALELGASCYPAFRNEVVGLGKIAWVALEREDAALLDQLGLEKRKRSGGKPTLLRRIPPK